jgi:hypothetical protein
MFRRAIIAVFIGASATVTATQMIGQSPKEMVQVAPGVSVPSKGSVWAVGSSGNGSPVQLYRSPIKVDRHWVKNIAGASVGSFLYRPSMSIEIHGAHAETRLTMQKPVFYVRQAATFEGEGDLRPGAANDSNGSDLELVRLKSSKEKRIEESFSTNGFGLDAKRKVNKITLARDNLDSGWLKLSPIEPLETGEYAIVALPRSADRFCEYAYDFGIDTP